VPQQPYRRKLEWRVTRPVWEDFLQMCEQLEQLPEDCDEAYALREDIRCLPGHPTSIDEFDFIQPVMITVTTQVPLVTLH